MRLSSYCFVILLFMLLFGCGPQSSNPREGGLFSYNPKAYEDRLKVRQDDLAATEQAKKEASAQSAALEADRKVKEQEKKRLEKELAGLNKDVGQLEKRVQKVSAETASQQHERQRILTEINKLKKASAQSADMDNSLEQQRELDRLKKRQLELEAEVEQLMQL